MSLLLIGIVPWLLLVVFVCALGRAAKVGDRREPAGPAAVPSDGRGERSLGVELAAARRARAEADPRLASLGSPRQRGAA